MSQGKTTVSHMLGEIVWVLSQSPVYKRLAIADLEWMVMPPMLLNQFRVFRKDEQPVGFALWAYLSPEVEARLEEKLKKKEKFTLTPAEWKSGDRLWLIELVSPFHTPENNLNEHLLADLTQGVFKGQKFRFVQHGDVMHWELDAEN